MEFFIFLGILIMILYGFWLLEKILTAKWKEDEIVKIITEELFQLEEKHPLKCGYNFQSKVRWDKLIIKFSAVRGKDAWEICKTVTRYI